MLHELPSGQEEERKELFDKDELHIVESPSHVVDPERGFVEAPVKATLAIGNEEMVLNFLRSQGFSEEAIKAFKSGKILRAQVIDTPFGKQVVSEDWEGRETTPPPAPES